MRVNCADLCEMLHSAKISLCKEQFDQALRVYSKLIICSNFRKKNYRRRELIMKEKRLK